MKFDKQVDRNHYQFGAYMDKKRWASHWHQIDEALRFQPQSVLEVGCGLGIFKSIMNSLGVTTTTLDIAADLNPDIVGSILDIPVEDKSFDVVCAFQVMEHLPFEYFKPAVLELSRISRKAVLISLPDAKPTYVNTLNLPFLGRIQFRFDKPFVRYEPLPKGGEHYWEISRPGYPIEKILDVLNDISKGPIRSYRVPEKPYHRFFCVELN